MNSSTSVSPTQPRVAFVSMDLWVGGGTIFIIKLASELMRRGIPCHVFGLHDENSLAEDFERLGIPVFSGRGYSSIFEDRLSAALQKLRDFAPTAIVGEAGMDVCELLQYVPQGVQRICVFHLVLEYNMHVARRYRAALDRAVAVSKEVEEGLNRIFEGSLPIHCIELGVPIPRDLAPRSPSPDQPLRILYLGRLEDPAKRVRTFPVIFERLKASGIPFSWTIAGDGPERKFLEEQMKSTDPSQKVHFSGIVPYFEVPQLLAAHDVFLLTSDSESFCLSLHEAMGAGLVPVASAIPGRVSEVVTPRTGLSVPPDNLAGYADAIVWLHGHREELKEMSAAAREMMSQGASVEKMADRWLPLLTKVSAEKPAWPRRWHIRPPAELQNMLRFSRPFRPIRRILARFRR